ncbi:MAG: hypothetical protein M3Q88_01640 [Pseudomonadota bacterium]|nr:hypothetical protein [Pseudomonadota bacterium]
MNGGIVPLLLISATVGLILAFAPLRMAVYGLLAFAGAAMLGYMGPKLFPLGAVFIGLWLSVVGTAVLAYLPVARWRIALVPVTINDGLWLGACAAMTSTAAGLFAGILTILLVFPAKWLVERQFAIVIKVIASWMIAIASLSMFVSLMPTPGYEPDHME